MIRFHRGCTLLLVLLFAAAWGSPASGQSLTRGAVDGVVQDSAGSPLAGTSVILRDLSTGISQTVTTPRSGRFQFFLLLPGEYELLAERFGSRPHRMRGISVRPGRRLDLSLELGALGPSGPAADTARYTTSSFGELGAGGGRHFSMEDLRQLPEEHQELSGVARLSSASGPELDVQGLPGYLSGVVVDGIPVTLARTQLPMGMLYGATHLSLSGFGGADLATGAVDVELPGRSGGLLSGYTLRGTPELRVRAFATAGAGSPHPADIFAGAIWPRRQLGGGAVITGPVVGSVASFSAGLEGWLQETDSPSPELRDSVAGALAGIVADDFGLTLPELTQGPRRAGALSGFGRVDWQVAPQHSVSARTNFSAFSHVPDALGSYLLSGGETRFDGGQLSGGMEVISRLGERLTQSIRLGLELADRDYLPARRLRLSGPQGQSLADTRILDQEWSYGFASGASGGLRQAVIRASETLNYETDRHALKGGLAVSVGNYEFESAPDRAGVFLFSGLGDFAAGRGAFVQTLGPPTRASFSLPQLAGYLQDEWRAAPGLELVVGVRYDLEALPKNELVPNLEWAAQSGLDPLDVPLTIGRVSPRIGFRWDPALANRWLFTGSVGLYSESVDPTLLADFLAGGAPATVRRGLGDLALWPALPDSSAAPVLGSRITLLAPAFGGPRTLRAGLGLSRVLRAGTILSVSGDYRRTDVLPRARDLNLLPLPIAHDQYGRPVYGRLAQAGGLLLAESGSNRRFSGFDQVLSIDVDGRSSFSGVTVALDHQGPGSARLFASYTFSRTRDNWPLGRMGGVELPAFPESQDGFAEEEVAGDLDIPDRAVVSLTTPAPWMSRLRFGALYRYRSGYPFTPGFGPGVDANGDGAENDPAFVDPTLPGMEALLAAWPCLGAAANGFAPRNACRGADTHTLDVRATLDVIRNRSYSLSLQADGMNLLGYRSYALDRALYHVDGSRALTTDPATGVVTVPLLVNERFGESLRPVDGGRVFRLGLRLDY